MLKSQLNLLNNNFSHIYIEKEALNYTETDFIISHFKSSKVIEISSYKEIFSRPRQDFSLQKSSMNLILAVKHENYIYKGADVCQDFGNEYFYYTSSVMNCIYDCEYCYLQGMYPSSNIVIFVNLDDVFKECMEILSNHKMYLCISYDTDLLALENITGFVHRWIDFAKKNNNLKIELRTKSASFSLISDADIPQNFILAWTLSPDEISNKFENRTPSLEKRLADIKYAVSKNLNVRLCFDPILYVPNWKTLYNDLVKNTFESIPCEDISDVSIGVFRISKEYMKNMVKVKNASRVLAYPFCIKDGVCTYSQKDETQMKNFVYNCVLNYIKEDRIYL